MTNGNIYSVLQVCITPLSSFSDARQHLRSSKFVCFYIHEQIMNHLCFFCMHSKHVQVRLGRDGQNEKKNKHELFLLVVLTVSVLLVFSLLYSAI